MSGARRVVAFGSVLTRPWYAELRLCRAWSKHADTFEIHGHIVRNDVKRVCCHCGGVFARASTHWRLPCIMNMQYFANGVQ